MNKKNFSELINEFGINRISQQIEHIHISDSTDKLDTLKEASEVFNSSVDEFLKNLGEFLTSHSEGGSFYNSLNSVYMLLSQNFGSLPKGMSSRTLVRDVELKEQINTRDTFKEY